MGMLQFVVLAIIQGITEFLPVSSSAHLILTPALMGASDQGALIDLMAHGGSLLAVIAYYRKDVGHVLIGMLDMVRGRFSSPNAQLFWLIAIATPPGLAMGAVLYLSGAEDLLRDPLIIAWASLIFALPLWAADAYAKQTGSVEAKGWRAAVLIGFAQILAFIPGTSRSGITMTAARALGISRTQAARFSMLISIPLLAAMALAAGLSLYTHPPTNGASFNDGLVVMGLSAVTAYAVIAIFMRLVERIGLLPFALYRIALSAFIFLTLV
jgi:undecaprenyl-diphosphatase